MQLRFELFLLLLVIAKLDRLALFLEFLSDYGDPNKPKCLDCCQCQRDVQKTDDKLRNVMAFERNSPFVRVRFHQDASCLDNDGASKLHANEGQHGITAAHIREFIPVRNAKTHHA